MSDYNIYYDIWQRRTYNPVRVCRLEELPTEGPLYFRVQQYRFTFTLFQSYSNNFHKKDLIYSHTLIEPKLKKAFQLDPVSLRRELEK